MLLSVCFCFSFHFLKTFVDNRTRYVLLRFTHARTNFLLSHSNKSNRLVIIRRRWYRSTPNSYFVAPIFFSFIHHPILGCWHDERDRNNCCWICFVMCVCELCMGMCGGSCDCCQCSFCYLSFYVFLSLFISAMYVMVDNSLACVLQFPFLNCSRHLFIYFLPSFMNWCFCV